MLNDLQCNECGASPRGLKLCHELFDDLLSTKYLGDGEAYRLAVACYTFQHPASHSGKAWWFARCYLEGMVHDGLSPSAAREQAHQRTDHLETSSRSPLSQTSTPIAWRTSIVDFVDRVLQIPMEAALQWAQTLVADYERWEHHANSRSIP